MALNPLRVPVRMAEQTRVRAVFLTEAHGHFGVRDIVNLVRAHTHEHAIHNAGHVALNTTTGLAIDRMVGMRRSPSFVLKLGVATGTHPVGLVFEFERSGVG
ncbi:MAG: hypothetical protein QOI94_295, partial [Acidobacteriaceae bacterium]|nr:hypothetical protein [Acidobacteriaceae bacterium]